MGLCRFRTMKDSFYILLRDYVRVDEVTVRIMDTRVYHEFGTPYLLREFQYKESSYDELRKAGFTISSEWSLSDVQHDQVFPHLQLRLKTKDKITFA